MRENHKAQFHYSEELVEAVAGRCREVESGARNVDHILTRSLLPEVSVAILSTMAAAEPIEFVGATVDEQGEFQYEIR